MTSIRLGFDVAGIFSGGAMFFDALQRMDIGFVLVGILAAVVCTYDIWERVKLDG